MAPAAASSNWLSFSLSPMEILATTAPHHHHHHHQYYLDSLYSTAAWGNSDQKAVAALQQQHQTMGMGMYTDYGVENPATVPKLEDFFCDNTNNNNHSASYDSHHTDDSSSHLTHTYDNSSSNNNNTASYNYFAHEQHQHDLKAAMASFSANSGSEVDDSGPLNNHTQLACAEYVGQSIESAHQPELVHAYSSATANAAVNGGSLSLSVAPLVAEKTLAVVAASNESENNSNKKVADTFGHRTSIYRGVTRHRWTGRYEAHLWDNSCRREGQARKGRQVYLGGYEKEEKAARAYDLAALKYWGPSATTNFPISDYTQELEDMKHATKQEFIASLRRKSSGFSRGASIYRGVTRHHQQGRWQARIGRVAGNKDLYLGTFATEEEAAEAYDIAAIKFRGVNAVTNFEMNRYDVDAILKSNLPIGGAAKRLKLATAACEQKPTLSLDQHSHSSNGSSSTSSTINFAKHVVNPVPPLSCAMPYDTATAIFHQNLLHHLSSNGGGHVVNPDSYGPSMAAAMTLMRQTPTELYIWPQQPY